MSQDFEKKTNSRVFLFLKRIGDTLVLNLIFVLVSALSAFVLFFPGLVALTTCLNKMINYEYYNPFLSFFEEIKNQWSFMWRLEVLCMVTLAVLGGIGYLYYVYIVNYGYTWIIWAAIAIVVSVTIILIIVFLHLLIYNEYFKDDTFFMMIRKSALIARKKPLISLLMFLFLLCDAIATYIIPYISIFISFSLIVILNLLISQNTYKKIYLEEEKRMLLGDNLFLPQVVEEDKKE